MGLLNNQFNIRYTKSKDDIANEFYLPCMRDAEKYDRISGYFRSTIFIIAWRALKEFVANGSTMRIICSPYVSSKDEKAVEEGYYARNSKEAFEILNQEIEEIFKDDYIRDPARVLACLIATKVL